ncbi:hypothetical protein [Nitrosococcus wardiae]|uniref:Uncharacterized protein n=1 Tax=Nitrosococcus wardiae TaxID=1814290 RepID=A0A4P7BWA4_9GAMM|nr:hypothetical protein [Nitrosococcus wardiae]QBQ54333.1 hypothetical protein E3U44_07275 [Nitrosococcus wardiae]
MKIAPEAILKLVREFNIHLPTSGNGHLIFNAPRNIGELLVRNAEAIQTSIVGGKAASLGELKIMAKTI